MLTSFTYFDLIETFPQRGCAVCNLIERDAQRQIDVLLGGEAVIDVGVHQQLRASRGLCADHAQRLIEQGEPYKVAALYQSVLDEVLQIIERTPASKSALFKSRSSSPLADALQPIEPCIVCQVKQRSETAYLRTLSEQIDDEKLQNAFRASEGLCLPHFRGALEANPDRAGLLTSIQRDIWQRLEAELKRFIAKIGYPYTNDQIGSEADSWKRTVARMSGQK